MLYYTSTGTKTSLLWCSGFENFIGETPFRMCHYKNVVWISIHTYANVNSYQINDINDARVKTIGLCPPKTSCRNEYLLFSTNVHRFTTWLHNWRNTCTDRRKFSYSYFQLSRLCYWFSICRHGKISEPKCTVDTESNCYSKKLFTTTVII